MVLGAAGWGLLLLIYIPAVMGLYERGYGKPQAVAAFVGLPSLGLCLSIVVPLVLHHLRRLRGAKIAAILGFLAVFPAVFATFMMAAI